MGKKLTKIYWNAFSVLQYFCNKNKNASYSWHAWSKFQHDILAIFFSYFCQKIGFENYGENCQTLFSGKISKTITSLSSTEFLTLEVPIAAAADNIFIFLFFRVNKTTFHVNHLLGRPFTWNVKSYFHWKKKKNRMLSSANLHGTLRVNINNT